MKLTSIGLIACGLMFLATPLMGADRMTTSQSTGTSGTSSTMPRSQTNPGLPPATPGESTGLPPGAMRDQAPANPGASRSLPGSAGDSSTPSSGAGSPSSSGGG
jgi:hypothetical protein